MNISTVLELSTIFNKGYSRLFHIYVPFQSLATAQVFVLQVQVSFTVQNKTKCLFYKYPSYHYDKIPGVFK